MQALGLLLFTLLSSMFQGIVDFLMKYFSKKVAFGAAVATLYLAATTVFIAVCVGAINAIHTTAPAGLLLAWGWFMPPNAVDCFAAITTVWTARFVYDLKQKMMKITVF
ncbi:MAG: DUF5455 family protein [Candidatus Saccharimonadales bacterium]